MNKAADRYCALQAGLIQNTISSMSQAAQDRNKETMNGQPWLIAAITHCFYLRLKSSGGIKPPKTEYHTTKIETCASTDKTKQNENKEEATEEDKKETIEEDRKEATEDDVSTLFVLKGCENTKRGRDLTIPSVVTMQQMANSGTRDLEGPPKKLVKVKQSRPNAEVNSSVSALETPSLDQMEDAMSKCKVCRFFVLIIFLILAFLNLPC